MYVLCALVRTTCASALCVCITIVCVCVCVCVHACMCVHQEYACITTQYCLCFYFLQHEMFEEMLGMCNKHLSHCVVKI